jgi:hypothetical protein
LKSEEELPSTGNRTRQQIGVRRIDGKLRCSKSKKG